MKQLVVISGKGGTGKTSVVAALASVGPKKVLADCDVDAADLHLILSPTILETNDFISGVHPTIDPELCVQCGLCVEHCKFGAISENFSIIPEKCEGCGVCAFVCPAEAVTEHPRNCGKWFKSDTRFGTMIHAALGIGEENSGKLVTTVRNASTAAGEENGAEIVLVDGSPGVGCPVIASLTNADLAVFVAEPTISAVHDLKRVHKLTEHFKIPSMTIINKCGINEDQENEIKRFCLEKEILIVGELPYDMGFTKAQLAGLSAVEFDPDGLGKNIKSIWEKMEKNF
ncbi:MinD superfamily P-loop ATPase, contains an inserted ferredoxin domain [Maridesulfovibrio ferrireducens]|uniref:MinD superfamily P-loop ATPase, contains an inserted ferredoxin domain n=1 Tax=Maridesulfovibrio ferrireducens TaxID=246191 RepID=A0A1G9HF54_9BACT|nr:ATP-binding protein [Maridesulfovibrio ferrireducens]SDL11093.1 MinD superfamily P-loop ATPase, contains an inserted ferredoxin domain [Maridesulfovibrio ferrireducens]